MIHADGLAKRFDGRLAVAQVTFEVLPGEVFGLLGPNGGGKTTTMRMLAGLVRPSEGTARIAGHDLSVDDDARHKLGFLTEQPGLYDRLTAYDNLAYFARLADVPEAEVGPRVTAALERLGLAARAHDKAGNFSKGMKQRLAIARAILHRPPALLLDEPTSGLDPESASDVRTLIRALAAEGTAVIVSTHNLAEAERLCRRVAVVKNRLLAVVEDLHAVGGAQVTVELASPLGQAGSGLQLAGAGRVDVMEGGHRLVVTLADGVEDGVPAIVAGLVSMGARIRSVVPGKRRLEDVYLSLVGMQPQDAAGAVG